MSMCAIRYVRVSVWLAQNPPNCVALLVKNYTLGFLALSIALAAQTSAIV